MAQEPAPRAGHSPGWGVCDLPTQCPQDLPCVCVRQVWRGKAGAPASSPSLPITAPQTPKTMGIVSPLLASQQEGS